MTGQQDRQLPTVRFLSVDARRVGLDLARLAALIGAHAPDLVCVHGAPNGPRWRTVSGALARQAGLVVVAGGRNAAGNLLLSGLALDVVATGEVRLGGPRPWRPAGGALALLRRQGRAVAVAAAGLAGALEARRAQAASVQRALTELAVGDVPAVLGVRGAEPLGSPAADALGQARTALPAGVFVDRRIAVGAVRPIELAPRAPAALLASLTLPA